MYRTLIAGALIALAAPAFAAEPAHNPQQVSDALKAGCTVHAVHTPAGKTVHQPAIVQCKRAAAVETASRAPASREVKAGTN